jgi:citrate synthase
MVLANHTVGAMNAQTASMVAGGLDGVVAAATRLSMVDGERGELVIAGYRLEQLSGRPFEQVVAALWNAAGVNSSERMVIAPVPAATLALLQAAADRDADPMDALRMAVGTLSASDDLAAAKALVGTLPAFVATYARLLRGQQPVAPRADLGLAANFLYMLNAAEPHPELVRGLDTYLSTVSDHGLNASTFTARVIASTGADFISAATGAIGALKGPLHGGAPGPALDMVFEIGEAARAEAVLRAKIERGERLMGFGHRIYKVRDPRADVLGAAAARMFATAGDARLHDLARAVEAMALKLLEEYKPGRRLQTNVEFYTALLLHGLGIDTAFFTPVFAIGRMAGWTAHCFEQRATGRLIRPQSVYVGRMPG